MDSGKISIKRFFLNLSLLVAGASICQLIFGVVYYLLHFHDSPGDMWIGLETGWRPFVVSAVLVLVFSGGFRRYREDFLRRYPKAVRFTVIDVAVTLGATVLLCLTDSYISNVSLGIFILLIGIWGIALSGFVIVWICASIGFLKKRKSITKAWKDA
ncbi:hypothetical protein [Ruminococcus albus]|uniref:Uncharacterized protein n=1 Tax=Ruminococcus albus TaxID=1264 RepID=A0A1I1MNL2_RUMAL|nr:hypothetical protein [Ruminococcus albus]SFC84203.1 hypothetical protein SAMN02910406_02493 [Ruminococcus albus]